MFLSVMIYDLFKFILECNTTVVVPNKKANTWVQCVAVEFRDGCWCGGIDEFMMNLGFVMNSDRMFLYSVAESCSDSSVEDK